MKITKPNVKQTLLYVRKLFDLSIMFIDSTIYKFKFKKEVKNNGFYWSLYWAGH